jgi:5'-nucleotidase/UDP-sugar diphosphatase
MPTLPASNQRGGDEPRQLAFRIEEFIMKSFRTAAWTLFLVLISVSICIAKPVTVRILYINDFHGFVEPYTPQTSAEQAGGIAWLAAKAAALRSEQPTLLLAAGDMIQGNNWANLSQGESVIELMNLMGFDAMTVGNHEFDFGQDVLQKRIAEAKFPVLGANVEGFASLRPYLIREVGGIKVAIVGVVTEDTPVATHPRNVAGLKFQPPAATLARCLPELRRQADVVIVLSHIGYAADRKLAEQAPGIDIIIGGHSHTRVEPASRVGSTIIAQAWEHGKVLGVLDITVDHGTITAVDGRLEDIRPDRGEPNPAMQSLVAKYQRQVDAVLDGRAGESEVPLDGENVRKSETNFGDLIADVMRSASGAEAALINGGGIRTSIAAGPILVKNVYTALPFDNYIVAVRLTGKQLRAALEHGVARVEEKAGAFPQVAGIAFAYDPSAPAGARVRAVHIGNQPLDPDREYAVATNDFLAAGGDGYTAFGDVIRASSDFAVIGGLLQGEKLVYSDSGRWLRDAVIDYLQEQTRIAPALEGRITELH